MSAFIVTKETMDVAVSAIANTGHCRTFADHLIGHDTTELDSIGRLLFSLNVRAVKGRYPGDPFVEPLEVSYRFTDRRFLDLPERARLCRYLKALTCLIYQCTEDATLGDAVLAELVELRDALALEIAQALPEYEGAPWDA